MKVKIQYILTIDDATLATIAELRVTKAGQLYKPLHKVEAWPHPTVTGIRRVLIEAIQLLLAAGSLVCTVCGTRFYNFSDRPKKYCSRRCQNKDGMARFRKRATSSNLPHNRISP